MQTLNFLKSKPDNVDKLAGTTEEKEPINMTERQLLNDDADPSTNYNSDLQKLKDIYMYVTMSTISSVLTLCIPSPVYLRNKSDKERL